MYSYQYILSIVLFFVTNHTSQLMSNIVLPMEKNAKLQQEIKKAEQDVQDSLAQLAKSQQEHDMIAIIKASQRSHEAQLKLADMKKQLKK